MINGMQNELYVGKVISEDDSFRYAHGGTCEICGEPAAESSDFCEDCGISENHDPQFKTYCREMN